MNLGVVAIKVLVTTTKLRLDNDNYCWGKGVIGLRRGGEEEDES